MRAITGTLGNRVEVKSYVANLAGHISNQVRLNVKTTEGVNTQVKLNKKEALQLISELKEQVKNLK